MSIQDIKAVGETITIADAMAMPGFAEHVREWMHRTASRDLGIRPEGMPEWDCDDAAQAAIMDLIDPCEAIAAMPAWKAVCCVRKFWRRQWWQPRSRTRGRSRPATPEQWAEMTARGMSDNPVTIVAAMEAAHLVAMTACGRHAKTLRAMSMDDIRAMACPDMRGEGSIDPGTGSRRPTPQPVPVPVGACCPLVPGRRDLLG